MPFEFVVACRLARSAEPCRLRSARQVEWCPGYGQNRLSCAGIDNQLLRSTSRSDGETSSDAKLDGWCCWMHGSSSDRSFDQVWCSNEKSPHIADRELTGVAGTDTGTEGFWGARGLPAVTLPRGFVVDVSMAQPAAPFNPRVLLPSLIALPARRDQYA